MSQPSSVDHALRVSLLGRFEIFSDGHRVQLPTTSQRLVAFLALQGPAVGRRWLAGSLWPERTDERAAANLRSVLWRIRRIHSGLINSANDSVGLLSGIDIDVTQMIILAKSLISGNFVDLERFQPSWFAADLLPNWYDDWVIMERERLSHLRLHALEQLARYHLEGGRLALSIDAALVAIAVDPLRESAQRCLIEALLAEGNKGEAIRQLRRFRREIVNAFGLEPSAELSNMVLRDT